MFQDTQGIPARRDQGLSGAGITFAALMMERRSFAQRSRNRSATALRHA